MVDLAAEVVTAIASGAGGSIGGKGAEAITQIVSALRAKFRGRPVSRGALEISLEAPDDMTARDQLAVILRDHMRDDAQFREWLSALWAQVSPDVLPDASASANIISGAVHGNVIQARDVHGDIHLGGS
jgi:hypothetical protein